VPEEPKKKKQDQRSRARRPPTEQTKKRNERQGQQLKAARDEQPGDWSAERLRDVINEQYDTNLKLSTVYEWENGDSDPAPIYKDALEEIYGVRFIVALPRRKDRA